MDFKPVTLNDRKLFEKYYKFENSIGSHYSFTNSFIWQKGYDVKYAIIDGFLCVSACFTDKPYYTFPVGEGDIDLVLNKLIKNAGEQTVFTQLTKEEAEYLKDNFGFETSINLDIAEYVYETEKLIKLSGKAYHQKKNHLNSFIKKYEYTFEEINIDSIPDAKEFCLRSIEKFTDRENERDAIHRLFDNFFGLELTGAVIRVDGEIIAVTAGEMLNPETAVIHLEKADTTFSGSYAAINNLFAKNCFPNTKYINREEDMGIEGLRKAKQSYRPAFMVNKYMAVKE